MISTGVSFSFLIELVSFTDAMVFVVVGAVIVEVGGETNEIIEVAGFADSDVLGGVSVVVSFVEVDFVIIEIVLVVLVVVVVLVELVKVLSDSLLGGYTSVVEITSILDVTSVPDVTSVTNVTSSVTKVGSSVIPAFSVLSGSVEFIIEVVTIVVVVVFEVVVVVVVEVVVVVVVVVVGLVVDLVLVGSPTSLAHLTVKFSNVVDIGKHFPFDSLSIPTSISR